MTSWHVNRSRYIPCLNPIISYFSWDTEEFLSESLGLVVHRFDKGHCTAVMEKDGRARMTTYAAAYLLERIEERNAVREAGLQAGNRVVEITKSFSSQLEDADWEDLLGFLDRLDDAYNAFTKKSMFLWLTAAEALEPLAKEHLDVDEETFGSALGTLCHPREPSYSNKEEDAFYRIVDKAKQDGIEEVQQDIQHFSEQYHWFPFEYVGPEVWTPQKVRQRVLDAIKRDEQHTDYHDPTQEQELLLEKLGADQQTKDVFAALRTITLMQDD